MLIRTTQNYFNTVILLILAAACSQKNNQSMQGPPPAGVVTQKVTEIDAPYYDEYPATLVAVNQVDLRPQVNGYITGIYFKEGEPVKKGQKLYSLDQQQYEGAYQQSLANAAALEANLVKAQKDVERYRELDKHDAIAKQQVDNAEANYEATKRQVEASKASVRSVQTSVRYTTITAPFDGTIGISLVKLGAAVSAGQTILNTISSDGPIAVDISVDQKQIFHFAELQHQPVTLKDSTFRLSFNGGVYAEPGKISFIDRAVNAQTGTILVRLIFPNQKGLLRAGMTGTLKVLNNASQKSILIPSKAITEQLGEFFVYVVTDSNKVTQQHVVLGKQLNQNVIVKEGLKEGETIVIEGVQNLHEGSSIAASAASPEEKKEAKH